MPGFVKPIHDTGPYVFSRGRYRQLADGEIMRKGLAVFVFVLIALLALPHQPVRAGGDSPAVNVATEAQAIRDLLQQAMRAYRLGDYPTAFKLSRAAYLDHF